MVLLFSAARFLWGEEMSHWRQFQDSRICGALMKCRVWLKRRMMSFLEKPPKEKLLLYRATAWPNRLNPQPGPPRAWRKLLFGRLCFDGFCAGSV